MTEHPPVRRFFAPSGHQDPEALLVEKLQIHPGTIQTLPVFEVVEKGYLLGSEEDNVFIGRRELKPKTELGTEVEVFTYYNEERNLEATTQLASLQVGEVGCYRVLSSNSLGSFISIGSRRDILIPHAEQVESLEDGRMALVILLDDPENRRLYATTKLNRHLRGREIPYKRGDEVMMTIAEKIEIGRRVIIDGKYVGALFRQEMTDTVRLGEKIKGYVRKVEGKDIVVSMQREGMELLDDAKVKIMNYLEGNGGYVRLNDDTDPEEIKLRLHMSKKTFKKSAGMLFKEGKILLTKFGIKINKTGEIPDEWSQHKMLAAEEDDSPNPMDRKPKPAPKPKEEESWVDKPFVPKGRPAKSDAPARAPRRESSGREDAPRRDAAPRRESTRRDDAPRHEDAPRREDSAPSSDDKKPRKTLTFKGKQ
jgi:predicted RNA-binding protein (virulence factor B family)